MAQQERRRYRRGDGRIRSDQRRYYRRGSAGDTLNTCWHIAKLLQDRGRVSYFTKVGNDAFSSEFLDFLARSGIASDAISRDSSRSIGLYVISLTGTERSFSYWRGSSAARRLADGEELLTALSGVGLSHISRITLAIIGEEGRRNLLKALDAARSAGSVVSYDPNVRPRLWQGATEMQHALREALEVTDIGLPSFEDEAKLWGDAEPMETVKRISTSGVREIAVKNGAEEVVLLSDGALARVPPARVGDIPGAFSFMRAPPFCQVSDGLRHRNRASRPEVLARRRWFCG